MSDLTSDEQANVRVALRYLRARAGNWKTLARALRFEAITIRHVMRGEKKVSPTMAFRVARFAGTSIDGLLAGEFPPAGTCLRCGAVA